VKNDIEPDLENLSAIESEFARMPRRMDHRKRNFPGMKMTCEGII